MSKLTRIVPSVLAGAAVVFAACGDDGGPGGGTNSGDALASAEVQELAAELFGVLFSVGLGGVAPHAAAPVAEGISFAVAEPIPTSTESCEGGGSISVSGDVDASSDAISFDITEQFNNCVVEGQSTTFTINGDPNVKMTGDVSVTQTSYSINWDVGGGIRFTTDDNRSGTCSVSISIDGDFNFADLNNPTALQSAFTISGSVCGQSVSSIW
jgi:hypothetical protein